MDAIRHTDFRPETRRRIDQMVEIIDEYDQKLTARQLFYQLVSRDLIPNTPRSYQQTTKLLTGARYAGIISWGAIEDRGRVADSPSFYDSIREIVDVAARSFKLDRWAGQPNYVELWVEKQALAGVLEPVAHEWDVTLMVNKGYSSASAMHDSYRRIRYSSGDFERETTILYLGDHDPSGEDMVRDIEARLVEFGCEQLTVEKIALTMPQIKKYRPPPNPAKLTDSRAAGYIAQHGNKSWELDALPPRDLNNMVSAAIAGLCNGDLREAVIAKETADRERLKRATAKIK